MGTGCRFFEFDARARVRGAVTADFSKTVIQDDFAKVGVWKVGPFDGGDVAVAGGKLSMHLTVSGASHMVTTSGHQQTAFGDVRLETTYSPSPHRCPALPAAPPVGRSTRSRSTRSGWC